MADDQRDGFTNQVVIQGEEIATLFKHFGIDVQVAGIDPTCKVTLVIDGGLKVKVDGDGWSPPLGEHQVKIPEREYRWGVITSSGDHDPNYRLLPDVQTHKQASRRVRLMWPQGKIPKSVRLVRREFTSWQEMPVL
jgi:hypothetical protein